MKQSLCPKGKEKLFLGINSATCGRFTWQFRRRKRSLAFQKSSLADFPQIRTIFFNHFHKNTSKSSSPICGFRIRTQSSFPLRVMCCTVIFPATSKQAIWSEVCLSCIPEETVSALKISLKFYSFWIKFYALKNSRVYSESNALIFYS